MKTYMKPKIEIVQFYRDVLCDSKDDEGEVNPPGGD